MSRNVFSVLGISGLVVVCLVSIYAIVEVRNKDKEYAVLFSRYTKVLAPELPSTAAFAGEAFPMDLYYVREELDRELVAATYMHSSTIMMFKRAYRWFPVIEPILKKNGIPDDFKFLAVAESNLINVGSPAGAEGYWQFIRATGVKYGLEINGNVDERYNMEKATQAACDYFREAYKTFNGWTLVAASYNRGIEGLKKAMAKQKVGHYCDLYLNDETSRYVFRIVALKEVYTHPVKYGFYLRERDFYQQIPSRLIVVDSSIMNLPEFAKHYGINYRILRELNPWIQDYMLPNKSRKRYYFQVPREGAMNVETLLKKLPPRDTFYHDTLKFNEVH